MGAGASSGSTDNSFSRTGSVNTSSWRALTTEHTNLFKEALAGSRDSKSPDRVSPTLTGLMDREWGDVPYTDSLCDVVSSNLPGHLLYGQQSLQNQAAINPYSESYGNNTFNSFADEMGRAMSATSSGPAALRGGTAATGYAMGDVMNRMGLQREQMLAQNRQVDAGIQQGASQTLAGQFNQRSNSALQGVGTGFSGFMNHNGQRLNAADSVSNRLKLFSDLVPTYASLGSRMYGTEQNNLSGSGAQTSSSMGAGFNVCCFIFLEAYNGVLPESVRKYRDTFAPECSKRRNGYIRMSRYLVPLMRMNYFVRGLVNFAMVKPLTSYGEWYYGNNKFGWVFYPIKAAWFKFWKLTGK